MVSLFGRGKRDIVIEQEEKAQIAIAVGEEKRRQAKLAFERKKARAVARIRSPFTRKLGKAVRKGAKIGRKEIGKSLMGFAQKIGKPSTAEKETVVIIGGTPRRVKGRVRIVRAQEEPFGDLGLGIDLLGEGSRRKKPKGLKPMRFF